MHSGLKGRGLWAAGLAAGLAMAAQAADRPGGFRLEAGTEVTAGRFTYGDAKVVIAEEPFNPRVSLEYALPNSRVSIGALYSMSENGYSLDFDDGKKRLDGDLDVERRDLVAFLRFGDPDRTNLRLGYRRYRYELSNGRLDETRGGAPEKRIRDGSAEGDLSTGLDAELNLVFGGRTRFALLLGAAYFKDAEYSWEYRDELDGNRTRTGTAKLDAVSARFGPELSVATGENLRLFLNYTVTGTAWIGSRDEDEEYAGVDVKSAFGLGLRYAF